MIKPRGYPFKAFLVWYCAPETGYCVKPGWYHTNSSRGGPLRWSYGMYGPFETPGDAAYNQWQMRQIFEVVFKLTKTFNHFLPHRHLQNQVPELVHSQS